MSFANLKRQTGNLDKISKAIEELNRPAEGADKDENYWRPEVDKAGNGMAVFRFLPGAPVDGDDALPWAKIFTHGFQGPGGKWFIDNCLTTVNKQCPVCEHNSTLWNSGIEANKETVRKQKRKLSYISNVYIISDPKHPENEGKVKLFRYGKKIFDKITEAMKPQFEDETPINPFDLWTGANFKIKIRKVEGYANYDKSEFEKPGPLLEDDTALEAIYNSEFSLSEIVAPKVFKEYADLEKRMNQVLGLNGAGPTKTTVDVIKEKVREGKVPEATETGDDDADLNYFKNLAETE